VEDRAGRILASDIDSLCKGFGRTPHVNTGEGRMSCGVKIRLTSEYEAATSMFSEAVTELRRKMGTSTKEDYERFGRAANEARVKSEQARLALEQHIAEHRC
jgi:hypothetical protein